MKWVVKTSSVRVVSGNRDRIFRSLDDLPPALRKRVIETIEGPNSETILIANQAAYDRVSDGVKSLVEAAEKPAVIDERSASRFRSARVYWTVAGGAAILGLWAIFLWTVLADH